MFGIVNLTKKRPPRVAWQEIAEHVLGKRYDMSLVFAGDARSKALNRLYRKKNKIANVLSFPISPDMGEVMLNLTEAAREAKLLGTNVRRQSAYLFIHGLLHLKGYRHGSTMEHTERELVSRFV